MWPVTDRFLDTLQHDHQKLSRIEILIEGETVMSVEGEPVVDPFSGKEVLSTGGKVEVSRSNIRRSGDAVFTNLDGVISSSDIRELFTPLRNEFRIWSGVQYWDGDESETEFVPVGTFVIDKADARNWPYVRLSGYDRMWIVQRSTLTEIRWYSFERVMTVIEDLYREALPPGKQSFNFPSIPDLTPFITWDEQSDRAEAGQQIALSAGWVVYVDPMGTFVAMQQNEPSSEDVVATYQSGSMKMFRPERAVSGESAFNVVIAKGESPDAVALPPRGIWEDNNPLSLTYVGSVGRLPYYYTSPILDTNEKALKAASTIGIRESGLTDSIVVPIIPNPAHESGDVIYVEDAEQEIAALLVVDDFNVPIRAVDGVQELQCRTQVFE